jgi:hypothetical protein
MKRLRWFVAPLVVAFLAFSVACGGDDDKDNGGASATGPSGSGAATSQVLDLTKAAETLLDVKSFRFDVSLKIDAGQPSNSNDAFGAALLALFGNIKADGAFLAPDSYQVKMQVFGQTIEYIKVGNEAFVNDGSGWAKADPDSDFSDFGLFSGSSPTDFAFDFLPAEVLRGAKTKSETVNGVTATRYSFDKAALADIATELGESAAELDEIDQLALDVWLTDDNIPVKVTMKMNGEYEGSKMSVDMEFNVRDLNKDIKIEKPKL